MALEFTVLPTGQVRLTWLAPSTGTTPTSYTLYAGTSAGARDLLTWVVIGGVLEFTSAAAVPPGQYFVRVHAKNRYGEGPASNEVLMQLGDTATTPPGAPGTLAAVVNGQRLDLAWTAAAGAASYVLEIGTTPGGPYARRNIGALTTFNVTAPEGTYYLRVRGLNAQGEGPPSNEVTAMVVGTLQAPGAPSGLTSSVAGSNVTLSWTAPDSGGPVDEYVIEIGINRRAVDVTLTSFDEVVFAPSVPAGTYYVRVRGRNAAGTGGPTGIITVLVP